MNKGNLKNKKLVPNIVLNESKYYFLGVDMIYGKDPTGSDMILNIDIDNWKFNVNGEIACIHWDNYKNISIELKELLKGFIYSQFRNLSPTTIKNSYIPFLRQLNNYNEFKFFPWNLVGILNFFNIIMVKYPNSYYCLKSFYKWGYNQKLEGFEKNILSEINDIKVPKKNQYSKIFLRQTYLEEKKSLKLVNYFNSNKQYSLLKINDLQNLVLLQLCFELAPRPSQIYMLNHIDFKRINGENHSYSSLLLSMSKKRLLSEKEIRNRQISESLGNKIERLIYLQKEFFPNNVALFIDKRGKRSSATKLIIVISKQLKIHGDFDIDESTIQLRHNLAQSLADQGASAEIIANIMGHNSTVPARAYIAATPKIAEIKTRALGKNNNYTDIMKMFSTGKIINKSDIEKEKWVKGIAGMQYIVEIGGCTLDKICPKNPVYSCYTCDKFNPFKDGEHKKVLKGLQENIQKFIDIGTSSGDVKYNRTIGQLEDTIIAVKKIINYIKNYE